MAGAPKTTGTRRGRAKVPGYVEEGPESWGVPG